MAKENKKPPTEKNKPPKVNVTQLWARLGQLAVQEKQAIIAAEKARQDMAAIYQQIANLSLENKNG